MMGEHNVRCRRGAACAGAGAEHAPSGGYLGVCVYQVQCTPRLLAAAELLDDIKCGIVTKRLGVVVGERSSRGGRR